MRVYHQVYDNDHYNRYYPMVSDPNTLPSGYGAIPYTHGFIRNKLTPKPWGVRLPATYSRIANAGGYFNAEADTDMYIYASTGIGAAFNDGISDSEFYKTGSPFNYGPVSYGYDITISGVTNPTYPGNSGCNWCSYFNGDYHVSMAYTDGFGFSNNTEGVFNGALFWNNTTYCKPDTFPRGSFCVPRGNWPSPPYVPTLLLAEMVSPTGTHQLGRPEKINIAHNVLSFTFQPTLVPFLLSSWNPVATPFVFALDFGEFDFPFNPASGYRRKPHMLDDTGFHLPPNTGTAWKFAYTRDANAIYNGNVLDGYLTTNKNYACDFSQATCFVRPRKYTPFYDPKEVLAATANRFDVGMNKAVRNYGEIDGISDSAGTYPFYPFSGITPNSYDLYMNVDNIASGEPFCDTCNNYYYKRRTLVKNLPSPLKIDFLGSTRLDGYQADAYSGAIGNPYINDSGYFLESYNWQGITSSPFQDLTVANNPYNFSNNNFINNHDFSRYKVLMPNALGICEFGCDEDNIFPSFNSFSTPDGSITGYLNNFCNNAIQLDVVTKYNAIISGGFNSFVYYSGWTDAYLYFGKLQPAANNNSAVGLAYPYRLKKRLCDDRTGVPQKCNQFIYPTFGIDSGIGLINPSIPISGGWTYERWTSNEYEAGGNIRALRDVSGLCNMAQADAYLMPNYHRNLSQCVGGLPCALCKDLRIPNSLTVQIDGGGKTDVIIMKRNPRPSFPVADLGAGGSDGTSLLGFPPGQNQYVNINDYCEWSFSQSTSTESIGALVRGVFYQDPELFLGPDNPFLQFSIAMTSGLSNVFHDNPWFCCGNTNNTCDSYCTNVWGTFGNMSVPIKARFNPNIDCDVSISVTGTFGLDCCTDNCFDPLDTPVCTGRTVDTVLTFTFGDFQNGFDYL